jgi:hypothetical protein
MRSNLEKSGADKEFFGPTYKDSFKTTELSALVGYRFWFARLYGGYIFSAKVDKKDSGAVDFKTGDGYKFGATFYALKNLAFSLEYRIVGFDSKKPSPDEKLELEYNTMAFLVSFPFSI